MVCKPFFYILKGRDVVPVANMDEWARGFDFYARHIDRTEIGRAEVSTVFLGIDTMSAFHRGPPQIFETLVFGGPHNGEQRRCATYDEAEAQHAEVCALVRGERLRVVKGGRQ